MKRKVLIGAAVCAAALVLGGGLAWAAGPVASFDIPFTFEVHGKVMPPGHYVVTPTGTGLGKLALKNECCGKLVMAIVAGNLQANGDNNKVSAVFRGTNGKYVLSEIHRPGFHRGMHVRIVGGQTTIADQNQTQRVVIGAAW